MINTPTSPSGLIPPPHQFFMGWRDLSFWLNSARADHHLSQLQREHGTQRAFDLLYERFPDPWGYLVPHYRYQNLKYAKMLSLLPSRPYQRALDVGCGLGVFTRLLAPFVTSALGTELSGVAVQRARELSGAYPHVHFEQGGLRELSARSAEQFDLIVLADVLYYLCPLSEAEWASLIATVEERLQPGGILLLANHYFFSLDPQSRQVRTIHDAFARTASLQVLQEQRHPFFLVSVLEKQA